MSDEAGIPMLRSEAEALLPSEAISSPDKELTGRAQAGEQALHRVVYYTVAVLWDDGRRTDAFLPRQKFVLQLSTPLRPR